MQTILHSQDPANSCMHIVTAPSHEGKHVSLTLLDAWLLAM